MYVNKTQKESRERKPQERKREGAIFLMNVISPEDDKIMLLYVYKKEDTGNLHSTALFKSTGKGKTL